MEEGVSQPAKQCFCGEVYVGKQSKRYYVLSDHNTLVTCGRVGGFERAREHSVDAVYEPLTKVPGLWVERLCEAWGVTVGEFDQIVERLILPQAQAVLAREVAPRFCVHCDGEIVSRGPQAEYCSVLCRSEARVREPCLAET